MPAVISVLPRATLAALPKIKVMDLGQRNAIAEWMVTNALVEPIVQARGMDAGAVLRQKMDFILVDAADALGLDLGELFLGRKRGAVDALELLVLLIATVIRAGDGEEFEGF